MNLAWIDLETTDFNPTNGYLLEVAFLVTKPNLEIISGTEVSFGVRYEETEFSNVLKSCDDFVIKMHTENGLLDQLKRRENCFYISSIEDFIHYSMVKNDAIILDEDKKYKSPLCGNSVHFDRSWMAHHMKKVINDFSYRNIDVSTVQELVQRWANLEPLVKDSKHRALDDIKASVKQLKNLRENYFKI